MDKRISLREIIWKDHEPTYELLRRFGFKVEHGEVENLDEMLGKVFSEEEIKEIMGYRVLGSFRVWLLTKRSFYVNYWMYLRLTKTSQGYVWRYGDSLIGV